ncbi:efflux RND transporter periplasmic adaptor subunit [Tautonia sp. JC769]|uniref:efflux RND transporter periplasmic adaptor subunit n=1 Tax=Tautonia sp. JC769 TaxID=3232135 RepID=UPI0034588B25
MNVFAFVRRRPITMLLLGVGLASGGLLAADELGVDVDPLLHEAKIGVSSLVDRVRGIALAAASEAEEGPEHEHHRIVVTSPKAMDVTTTQPYVCQIHSRRHIDVCALESGYLEKVLISEGQEVKRGDLLFEILPPLYQAKLDAKLAEAQLAELEYNNTRGLAEKKVVSQNEVKLLQAKLAKAQAEVELAKAELNFTNIVAPFDGIVDRQQQQLGSLIAEGDVLTTLSDNSVMWVYFNVPEADYLRYMAGRDRYERIDLKLADGSIFPQPGKIGAIEAQFNNMNGNLAFRADFPNPDGLLRHGQTGTVIISRDLKGAIVIPQQATFELLDKQYVYVVRDGDDDDGHAVDGDEDDDDGDDDDDDDDDEDDDDGDDDDGVVHQLEIEIQYVLEDIYVLKDGILDEGDRIVLEGVREVREGEEVDYEFRRPEEVLSNLKFHAE